MLIGGKEDGWHPQIFEFYMSSYSSVSISSFPDLFCSSAKEFMVGCHDKGHPINFNITVTNYKYYIQLIKTITVHSNGCTVLYLVQSYFYWHFVSHIFSMETIVSISHL